MNTRFTSIVAAVLGLVGLGLVAAIFFSAFAGQLHGDCACERLNEPPTFVALIAITLAVLSCGQAIDQPGWTNWRAVGIGAACVALPTVLLAILQEPRATPLIHGKGYSGLVFVLLGITALQVGLLFRKDLVTNQRAPRGLGLAFFGLATSMAAASLLNGQGRALQAAVVAFLVTVSLVLAAAHAAAALRLLRRGGKRLEPLLNAIVPAAFLAGVAAIILNG